MDISSTRLCLYHVLWLQLTSSLFDGIWDYFAQSKHHTAANNVNSKSTNSHHLITPFQPLRDASFRLCDLMWKAPDKEPLRRTQYRSARIGSDSLYAPSSLANYVPLFLVGDRDEFFHHILWRTENINEDSQACCTIGTISHNNLRNSKRQNLWLKTSQYCSVLDRVSQSRAVEKGPSFVLSLKTKWNTWNTVLNICHGVIFVLEVQTTASRTRFVKHMFKYEKSFYKRS